MHVAITLAKVAYPVVLLTDSTPGQALLPHLWGSPPFPRCCPGLETGSSGDVLPDHNSSTQTAERCLRPGRSTRIRLGLHSQRHGNISGGLVPHSRTGHWLCALDSLSKSLDFFQDLIISLLRLTQVNSL